jgi:hypothetical protein
MTVAPIPVMALCPMVLAVVLAILAALFLEVTPVGMVFAVVPIVVVTVVAIVDPDLYGGLLRFGFGDNESWRNNGSSQE